MFLVAIPHISIASHDNGLFLPLFSALTSFIILILSFLTYKMVLTLQIF